MYLASEGLTRYTGGILVVPSTNLVAGRIINYDEHNWISWIFL